MAATQNLKLLSDLPETDPELLWDGLKKLSEQLARQIPDLPTTSPVMLSGDWGSGKTTLLKAIQNRLDPSTNPTVWFEAWRYEGESLLLPALMRALWDQAPRKPSRELRNKLWNAAVAVATGIGPSLAAALGGPAALGFQALLALRTEEQEGDEPGPPEDTTKKLSEGFRDLLDELWHGQQIVIFIDDLDRCGPQGAIDLLEAIRMLIGQATGPDLEGAAPSCRFVVALDRGVLAEAVAKKFSGISRYEGNRYLEKVFPIVFDLPQPEGTAIHQFVHLFLKKATEVGQEDDPNYLDALSVALSEPIFANPRLMKRCINRFYMVMRFERTSDDALDGDELEAFNLEEEAKQHLTLAKWIVASERWPQLRRLLHRRDDEYWHQTRAHLADAGMALPDTEAVRLLEERGIKTWLRRELLSGKGVHLIDFRVADRILRKWGL